MSIWTFLRPNICILGYGLFLAVNAAGAWGGVFPFLPMSLQTASLVLAFFTAHAIVFGLSFISAPFRVFWRAEARRKRTIIGSAIAYFLGWAGVVAAMYFPVVAYEFMVCAGALIGLGSAGLFMLWQRIFSGLGPEAGGRNLMLGTAYSVVIYFSLYLIPTALTTLLIPVVFLPIICLCIILTERKVDFSQTLFSDTPSEHPQAYRHAIKSSITSALGIGSIAFCCGIIRSLAIVTPSTGTIVNVVAMTASFFMALSLLLIWRRKDLIINVVTMFRALFPVIITSFFVIIIIGESSLLFFGGAMYSFYSCAIIFMMLQCMQISRDGGINPLFIYGFFAGITYLLHDVGFIGGQLVGLFEPIGLKPYIGTSVFAMWLLAIMYFLGQGGFRQFLHSDMPTSRPIELLSLNAKRPKESPSKASSARRASTDDSELRDRLSKQCHTLQEQYRLSSREREVVELLARGNSAASISEKLFISENTVKTHMHRIYGKLNIHKKQELLDLIESCENA